MNAGWKAVLACGLMAFASLTLGATYTVTSLADAGPGTLREKITQANANPGLDTIRFTAGLSGMIVLASTLPRISDKLMIDGTGASITISGNDTVRILDSGASSLTLVRLSFVQGRATHTATSGPYAGEGNGAAVRSHGPYYLSGEESPTLTVIDCTFARNNATSLARGWRGYFPAGGAISVVDATVTITGSTFDANSAMQGGAIWLVRTFSGQPASITNSTFSNNRSYSPDWGEECSLCGGAAVALGMDLFLTHSTFHNNSDEGYPRAGGAVRTVPGNLRRLVIGNSIFSTAPGTNSCSFGNSPSEMVDAGGNLSSDTSCEFSAPSSVSSLDAMLGPLRDNGGPTPTMSLLTGSPAINTGVNALAVTPLGAPLAKDQRGYARIVGASVDKGAYERAGLLDFTGPFFPIFNWPIFNDTWAGSLLPVRFGLNGYQGMAVFAQGFPTTTAVACGSGPFTPVAELAQSGGGTLTYDTKTQRYQYVLASLPAWKGTCRKLSMKFTDGSSIDTFFRFK